MDFRKDIPIVLFDNHCYLCTKFAKTVNFFARDKITMIGHYSELGKSIRESILDKSALDMFWVIDEKKAYGGRAAIFPLIKSIFSRKTKRSAMSKINDECQQDCKTVKAVFVRSSSLITNSKIIDL
jgi:predicted DCC family thiol-disulfide oxidoreductase YuxK